MAISKQLVINMIGDASQLLNTYNTVTKETQKFGKEIEKNGLTMKNVGTVMAATGGAIVGALTAMVVSAANTAGQIADLSNAAGASAESFQRLAYAAQQDSVTKEELSASLARLTKNMAEAARGTGSVAKVFEGLGISVTDTNGQLRSVDQVLPEIADRFKNIQNPAEKTALAMELFGKTGSSLTAFLSQGSEGMRAYAEEAEKLGIILSNESVAALDQFGDSLDTLKAGFGGIKNEIAAAVAPAFQLLADGLKTVLGWVNQIPAPIKQFVTVSGALAAALALVGGTLMTTVVPAITTMNPVVLAVIATVTMFAGVATVVYNNWSWLGAHLYSFWDRVKNAWQTGTAGVSMIVNAFLANVLNGLSNLLGWIPGWGDRLRKAAAEFEDKALADAKKMQDSWQAARENSFDQHYEHLKSKQKQKNQEMTTEDTQAYQLRLLRQIEAQQKAENAAREHAEKMQRILESANNDYLNELKRKYQREANDTNLSNDRRIAALRNALATELRILDQSYKKQREEAQENAEALALIDKTYEMQKTALTEEYNQRRNEINLAAAQTRLGVTASELVFMLDQVGSGFASLLDVFKDYFIRNLSAVEADVIAKALMGISIATSMAPGTWGASLAWIPGIKSNWAVAIAEIEAAKAIIRGLAEGGITTGPSINLIGEGKYQEAVLPLSNEILAKIGAGIVKATNNTNTSMTNNSVTNNYYNNNYNIGTMIGSDNEYKKLARKITEIQISENKRKGLS